MFMRWNKVEVTEALPTLKNHTVTVIEKNKLLIFGGYDGRRNHNELYIFDCTSMTWKELTHQVTGEPPAGRNGHSATLINNRLFIIGGWLGSGPLAADDLHIFMTDTRKWVRPRTTGTPPGPCNMHSADFIPHLNCILLFRGGDGSAYLNDMHALNVDTMEWSVIPTTGQIPSPRANHSSAVVDDRLFVFGGWDGERRLNDLYMFDTRTFVWTKLDPKGSIPLPRAGMSFVNYRDRIFLFGGSGPSAKCYNDLHVYDPVENVWLEAYPTVQENTEEGVTLAPRQLADYGIYGNGKIGANPNDQPQHDRILTVGEGPSHRAGHSCTIVNRKIFFFGGSYGNNYLNDWFVLDTDPPPRASITLKCSTQILQDSLRRFLNSEDFSDISFLVEGRLVYCHKVILSLLSERFRGMFTAGFRESSQKEIILPDIRYVVFLKMMEYLYTGTAPELAFVLKNNDNQQPNNKSPSASTSPSSSADMMIASSSRGHSVSNSWRGGRGNGELPNHADLEIILELMVLADQFMVDHLKQICERALAHVISHETVHIMLQAADRSNALQLKAICVHFIRNSIEYEPL